MRTLRRLLPTIVCTLWVILSRTAITLPDEVASNGKSEVQHLAPGEVPPRTEPRPLSPFRPFL